MRIPRARVLATIPVILKVARFPYYIMLSNFWGSLAFFNIIPRNGMFMLAQDIALHFHPETKITVYTILSKSPVSVVLHW